MLQRVETRQTHSGFIFTRLDEGVKALDLDLVGLGETMCDFTLFRRGSGTPE